MSFLNWCLLNIVNLFIFSFCWILRRNLNIALLVIIDSFVATVLRCFISLVLGHIIVEHHCVCLTFMMGLVIS
jgi:hypothetical protein